MTRKKSVTARRPRPSKRDSGPNLPSGFIGLSSAMYRFACHTAFLSKGGPVQPQTMLAISSVLHAVAALEAFVNEEIERNCLRWPELRGYLLARGRLRTRDKWHELPWLLFGGTLDKGAEPFQAFHWLVELRDALVHYTPSTRPMNFMPDLAKELSRYNFLREDGPGAGRLPNVWSDKMLTPACARWACETARAMVLRWYELAKSQDQERAFADWKWSLAYLDGKEPAPLAAPEVHGDAVTHYAIREGVPFPPELIARLQECSKAELAWRERRTAERRVRLGDSMAKLAERERRTAERKATKAP